MTDLTATLEGLTAPSREVDRMLAAHFDWPDTDWSALEHAFAPAFTSSLDAATALVERVLPGSTSPRSKFGRRPPPMTANLLSRLPALLIAILTALEARENG